MIEQEELTCNNYNAMVIDMKENDFEQFKLSYMSTPCPCCNCKDRWGTHGTYTRNVGSLSDSSLSFFELRLQRLICHNCECTTTIMPIDIVPYCQLDLYSYIFILAFYIVMSPFNLHITKMDELLGDIALQTVYNVRNAFNEQEGNILFTVRKSEALKCPWPPERFLLLFYLLVCPAEQLHHLLICFIRDNGKPMFMTHRYAKKFHDDAQRRISRLPFIGYHAIL